MRSRSRSCAQLLAQLVWVVCVGTAGGASWLESPDAPETPYNFQWTAGSGGLTDIQGTILSTADRDAFCIEIVDRLSFSASIPCPDPGTHDLWLFQTDGLGVSLNDGCSGSLVSLSGSNVFANGKYILVISASDNEAQSSGSQAIWDPPMVSTERDPDGPGAGGVFVDWAFTTPIFGGAEPYQVNLTGCVPCEVPIADDRGAWGSIKQLFR